MKKLLVLILVLMKQLPSFAQTEVDSATVDVVVMDQYQKPRYHDKILFRGKTSHKIFVGTTNKSGQFTIQLPEGDVYEIIISALADEKKYSTIQVPYTDASFSKSTITIMYEPARVFTLQNVLFESGSAKLLPVSQPQLNELVAWMKLKETALIEIQGHTDHVGEAASNLTLSLQRAQAVKNYLVSIGKIQSTRIQVKGMGEMAPIATNETEEGRKLNRRTEIHIISGD